jgi:uncharacterized membrane protein YoaK (UPF0700 family)
VGSPPSERDAPQGRAGLRHESPAAAARAGAREIWRSLAADERHGCMPVLLLGLTLLTGVVDAVSILSLGRVFVANMTGNVVFVGFAIADAPGFSLSASLAALAGFLIGAFGGGHLISAVTRRGVALLRDAVAGELVLIAVALAVAAAVGAPYTGVARDVLAAALAIAMGLQNAVARNLAVPDLTTTVLTMTLTGLAADASPRASSLVRRFLAVATMLAGATAGALLVLKVSAVAALGVATAIALVVASGAAVAAAQPQPPAERAST